MKVKDTHFKLYNETCTYYTYIMNGLHVNNYNIELTQEYYKNKLLACIWKGK